MEEMGAVLLALLRARVPIGTQPLIQLRPRGRMSAFADGGSLRSPRLRNLLPQGEKGGFLEFSCVLVAVAVALAPRPPNFMIEVRREETSCRDPWEFGF